MHTPKNPLSRKSKGFALILALILMSFVVLLLLSITSLVRVESRVSAGQQTQTLARQSAMNGLFVALGELQQLAGPDQRITAAANILGGSSNPYSGGVTPALGQASWVGVWKSGTVPAPGGADYDPSDPNEREFAGWLVSGSDDAGAYQRPAALDEVATDVSSAVDGEFVRLHNLSDGDPYMQVKKVSSGQAAQGYETYFAFAVEDEGIKADVSWSESNESEISNERYQQTRLAASPGPDIGALLSTEIKPFNAGQLSYPLKFSDLGDIVKLNDTTQVSLAVDSLDASYFSLGYDSKDWLRDQRANFTVGSFGLMTDVKWGGLRRDLSLAFEMDGDADLTYNEKPTKFNQQVGEFVGGDDRLTAPQAAIGMSNVKERFLYRDRGRLPSAEATAFSREIAPAPTMDNRRTPVVRGPNWWLLRDYANLYKRLTGSGGNYSLEARAYYPNASSFPGDAAGQRWYSYANMANHQNGNPGHNWDQEIRRSDIPDDYLYLPARGSYAPILLGASCAFALKMTNQQTDPIAGITGDLSVVFDPFFHLWNPYNRELIVENFAVTLDNGFPGHLTLWVTDGESGVRTQYGPYPMRDYLLANELADGQRADSAQKVTYLVKDLTLAPGQVLIVSADPTEASSAGATRMNDQAFPGININNNSGIVVNRVPKNLSEQEREGLDPNEARMSFRNVEGRRVELNVHASGSPDEIEYLYSNEFDNSFYANARYYMSTYLPPRGSEAGDMVEANATARWPLGENLQNTTFYDTWFAGNRNRGYLSDVEYHLPAFRSSDSRDPVGSVFADQLLGSGVKEFFGFTAGLTKPANGEGPVESKYPVEIFSQFNPAYMATAHEHFRPLALNQSFFSISQPNGINQFLGTAGISPLGRWGESYGNRGATAVPMKHIPIAPPLSLVEFINASLPRRAHEPFLGLGNSYAGLFTPLESPYGLLESVFTWGRVMASDSTWLLNDALFDRYYLSGLAPEYTIDSSGYSATGTLDQTIEAFFSNDYREANANPVLRPYLPEGKTSSTIVDELGRDDGYKKLGAYAMIKGAFNVNSTSTSAWEAFLRANRNLQVEYAQNNGTDTGSGTPFPAGSHPSATVNGAPDYWSGIARLDDDEIEDLANEIVKQVRLRGPFMSMSDFVNRRVGTPVSNETHVAGALQSAIDETNINTAVHSNAGGVRPEYDEMLQYYNDAVAMAVGDRRTTTGISQDLTQADLLLPLAPRLAARSDTFKIRAYGEVRSLVDGDNESVAVAYCEATVQRIPEYLDPNSDDPWDEATNPVKAGPNQLSEINQQFGRRFVLVDFRWLSADEI